MQSVQWQAKIMQLNPNWHELRQQEKCTSLAPPMQIFLPDLMILPGNQINMIYYNFHLKNSLEFFDKN